MSEELAVGTVIRPLRPLVYNFLLGGEEGRSEGSHFFRPTMHSKRLIEQPKFLLSVERKKIKSISGITQRAHSERPSRNSYRPSKLRTHLRSSNNQEDLDPDRLPKDKRIQSQELALGPSPRRAKQPHLHFNLRHLLQTRKAFNGEFSREDNIQGTNFPYYQYFSSEKSSLPASQQSARSRHAERTSERQRYISTTMAVRPSPPL